MRYFLTLSYNGAAYHGWQIQRNATSVQQTLERALSVLLKEEIQVMGAGRTDTGVHAARYVAHFDSDSPGPEIPSEFIYHLNCVLPKDIAVEAVRPVRPDAHARFDAVRREYKYYVATAKDPFRQDTAYYYSRPLDLLRMNEAAAVFPQYDDFTSFCKLHSDNKTHICKVYESRWDRVGDLLVYTVSADRFLRNMVRALVGTMLDVGQGRMGPQEVREVIGKKSRGAAGASAPAHGLFLTEVAYPEEIYQL